MIKEKILERKQEIVLVFILMILVILMGVFFPRIFISNATNTTSLEQFASGQSITNSSALAIALNNEEKSANDFINLSDLDYLTTSGMSQNGWGGHEIQKDKNQEGGILSLIVNGEKRSYAKGLSIHARGWATYDISELSLDYPRFIAKIGVDASRGTNGSLFYRIYASNDATKWDVLLQTPVLTGTSEAVNVDLSIEGYKYLRIYVDANGSNAADHGTIANAKLVTPDYVEKDVFYDRIHRVEYYDEILKEHDTEYNYNNNYKLILERELVNKLGFWNIQYSAETSSNFQETMEWILNDDRVLEEVIEVGEISNAPLFMQVLVDLHHKYQDALKTENGYVYEKMMIGLAAAYSTDRVISPLAFSFQSPTTYDYMERFELMKRLFDNNQFRSVKANSLQGEFVQNDWFNDYHVELMRMVMQDGTSNGDLIWLNGFTNEKQSVSFYMIGYVSPTYMLDKYYAEENREKYDQQFYLTKYGVPYGLTNGTKVPRYWMVFANGGICWNASRVGQSMYRVNGIPATGAYQVGHELYIQYYEDENGNGYWTPRYGNWSGAGSTWGGGNPYRYIFNWNNKYFADRHISGSKIASSTGYLYLGQANLNRLEQYQKSLYYNLTANSYTSDEQKVESYFKSLEVNDLNLDTYDNIITLYKKMSVQNEGGTITSHDWYDLANKIIEAYKFHPVAMFDLLKVIRPYLEGSERLDIDRLEKEALLRATQATAADTIQGDGVRTHARQLLNKAQPDPMTFSFDGENAGKIVKNPIYSLAWGYSLDGGKTFTDYKIDDSITLTSEELANITAENDIIINFMGLSYTFTIDITKGTLSSQLFANDLENRVVGVDLTYEWRNNESDQWTSYKNASPDNTGDKTLYVRRGYTGTQLASDSATYTFTADNQPNTRKYVPVSHLSIEAVSTEATSNSGAATYAIDGNYNTRYHSAWNGTDTERYITIKLDKPRYVSAVEFVPAGGGNGKIYDGTIWGSMDGKNWEVLSEKVGITYTNAADNIEQAKENTKSFEIENPKEVQYIKIVADRTNGDWFAARAFNIFQDLTSNERPTAGIGYSTTEPTRENVVARLVNISSDNYEILSPGGDTYEFTENGDFTFRFRDKETGLEGYAVATVGWIDRTAPTAKIEYSTTSATNKTVVATLIPSEDVKVTNNGDYQVDEEGNIYNVDGIIIPGYKADNEGNVWDADGNYITNVNTFTYEFLSNGEFTFEFEDRAGNKGTATAKVDWINLDIPNATITYDKTTTTSESVTASITFDKENVTVTNNNHKTEYVFTENGEFTFEYSDAAGNKGTATAKVDWIEKKVELPNIKLQYSEENKTKNPVTVTLINQGGPITITNNGGSSTYIFTKNGEFIFEYEDELGNVNSITAKVDWIIEDTEDNDNDNNNTDDNDQSSSSNNNSSNNKNENNSTNKGTSTNTNRPNASTSTGGNLNSVITTSPETNDSLNQSSGDASVNDNTINENKNQENNQKQKQDEEVIESKIEKNSKLKLGAIAIIFIIILTAFLSIKIKNRNR